MWPINSAISLSFNPTFRLAIAQVHSSSSQTPRLFPRYNYTIVCVLSPFKQPFRHFRFKNTITKPVSTGFQAAPQWSASVSPSITSAQPWINCFPLNASASSLSASAPLFSNAYAQQCSISACNQLSMLLQLYASPPLSLPLPNSMLYSLLIPLPSNSNHSSISAFSSSSYVWKQCPLSTANSAANVSCPADTLAVDGGHSRLLVSLWLWSHSARNRRSNCARIPASNSFSHASTLNPTLSCVARQWVM